MILHKLQSLLQEKSTQYYWFSQDILDLIGSDHKVFNFVNDWVYSEGPGNDERYQTNYELLDYLEILSPEEIELLTKKIKKKFKIKESIEVDKPDKPVIPKPVPLVPGTLVLVTNYGTDKEPRKYMWNKSRGEILKKNDDGTYKIRITDVKDSNVLYSKKWFDQEQKALTQKLNLRPDEFKTLKQIEDEEMAKEQETKEPKKKEPKEVSSEGEKDSKEQKEARIRATSRRLI